MRVRVCVYIYIYIYIYIRKIHTGAVLQLNLFWLARNAALRAHTHVSGVLLICTEIMSACTLLPLMVRALAALLLIQSRQRCVHNDARAGARFETREDVPKGETTAAFVPSTGNYARY